MLALVIGATLLGLVANIFAWKMPRASNMLETWAITSVASAGFALAFVAVFIADDGQAWWMLPALTFFAATLKAVGSWGVAERTKNNEQPSAWLNTLETLMQPAPDTTGWFQVDDLREFAISVSSGMLLHNNPSTGHRCIVISTRGMSLATIAEVALRHECQEVMAA